MIAATKRVLFYFSSSHNGCCCWHYSHTKTWTEQAPMDAVSGHSQHQPRYCKVTVTFARQFRASYGELCNPLQPGSSAAAKCWAERHVESPQIATPNLGCSHLYTRNTSPGSLCLDKRRSAAACFKSSSSRSRAVYFTWQPAAATVLCYDTSRCRAGLEAFRQSLQNHRQH